MADGVRGRGGEAAHRLATAFWPAPLNGLTTGLRPAPPCPAEVGGVALFCAAVSGLGVDVGAGAVLEGGCDCCWRRRAARPALMGADDRDSGVLRAPDEDGVGVGAGEHEWDDGVRCERQKVCVQDCGRARERGGSATEHGWAAREARRRQTHVAPDAEAALGALAAPADPADLAPPTLGPALLPLARLLREPAASRGLCARAPAEVGVHRVVWVGAWRGRDGRGAERAGEGRAVWRGRGARVVVRRGGQEVGRVVRQAEGQLAAGALEEERSAQGARGRCAPRPGREKHGP